MKVHTWRRWRVEQMGLKMGVVKAKAACGVYMYIEGDYLRGRLCEREGKNMIGVSLHGPQKQCAVEIQGMIYDKYIHRVTYKYNVNTKVKTRFCNEKEGSSTRGRKREWRV